VSASTYYGRPEYGRGFYGGRASIYSPVGATIQVIDRFGAVKAWFQIGMGNLMGLQFTADEAGSRDFMLFFATYVNIIKTDIIKIYIFDHDDPFFTGVVRSAPVRGSTAQEYTYSGFGLIDFLDRINTESQAYVAQTIEEIIYDLLDTRVVPNSQIIKNPVKIVPPAVTVANFNLNYVACKEAFDNLLSIANAGGDYLYGVDEFGEFFFRERSTDVVTLTVGTSGRNSIEEYQPEDSVEAKSRLYVLKKDGTFYNTYSTSDGAIDINEIKLTAPDIADADIDDWAEGQLAVLERNTREASINWKVETIAPTKLLGDGEVRIICNRPPTTKTVAGTAYGAGAYGAGPYGGAAAYTGYSLDDTLIVKEVQYTINDKQAARQIQLGAVPVSLPGEIIKLNKEIKALEISVGV